jgi:uncharacterized protein (TIGR03663 family)
VSFREKCLARLPVQGYWFLIVLVLVAGVLSRFYDLEHKAFHHDESLHAYYSHRVATGSPHEYSALLHGPFLYYFVGLMMWLFGSTDFVARGAAALFGVLLIALPLMLQRYWGRTTTVMLMLLFLFSPSFLYFGRFLREDAFTSVWVLGTVFGSTLFWKNSRPWALYFATTMLAFHFVNKENSYLHSLLWMLAVGCIAFFQNRLTIGSGFDSDFPHNTRSPIVDKKYLVINSASIFFTIFILFYSSFFRHSKGSLHGILDGLYRESLLYWWDQNQKRRIDGPFDYHLPIFANYEFLVLPFLILAWSRAVAAARSVKRFIWNHGALVVGAWALVVATFFLPRVALVPDACSYTSLCLEQVSPGLASVLESLAHQMHLSHSRHFLQILCYVAMGGLAFFATLQLRRKFESFVWFWLTGAIGIYSYVGEKVPWLGLYILIPLFLICSLELGRIFCKQNPELNSHGFLRGALPAPLLEWEARFSNRVFLGSVVWIVLALPFTLFKGYRVAFESSDLPQERLVFTQTTPTVKQVRDRWRMVLEEATPKSAEAGQLAKTPFKVAMFGDATWPFAWYVTEFNAGDFTRPTSETAKKIDVILLDMSELEKAKAEFPQYRIHSLSLRHWWVPGQNPSLSEIFRYFWTRKLYPRVPGGSDADDGTGDTRVLYLENTQSPVFAGKPPPSFLPVLAEPSLVP